MVETPEELLKYMPHSTALLDREGTGVGVSESFRALFLSPAMRVTDTTDLARALGPVAGADGRALPDASRPWNRALQGEEFSDQQVLLLTAPGLGRALVRFSATRLPSGLVLLGVVDQSVASKRESLLNSIVERLPAPFTVIRQSDRRVIEVNDELAQLTGLRREDLLGLQMDDERVQVSFTEFEKIAKAALRCGETHVTLSQAGNERPLHLLTWCRTFVLAGDEYSLAILVDITRFKEVETHLKEATESALRTATEFSRGLVQQLERLQSDAPAPEPSPAVHLTRRELEVVGRVGAGYTNQRIAQELQLTPQTVRNYVTRIYRKVGVTNRAEAIVWARERGLVNT